MAEIGLDKPRYHEVVEIKPYDPSRVTDEAVSGDRHGAFYKATAYEGWQRSIYSLAWWIRLHTNDLPILWNSGG